MRTLFSIRFAAAIAGVIALAVIASMALGGRSLIAGIGEDDDEPGPAVDETESTEVVLPGEFTADGVRIRDIDLVEPIFASKNERFAVVDGAANADTELIIDGSRSVFVKQGAVGIDYCDNIDVIQGCAILADLLGEAVVWFALVPFDQPSSVELPAIDVLVDGQARLVNGWELPYAPILERRCLDDGDDDTTDEFESYVQFRELLGDDFVAVFSTHPDERRLVSVVCRRQVPWQEDTITDAAG